MDFYGIIKVFSWIFFHLFQHVVCNRDKILTALVTSDSIIIWYVKPCVPIISHRRSPASIQELGRNVLAQWRPDSSMIVVIVSTFYITISISTSVRPCVVVCVSAAGYRVLPPDAGCGNIERAQGPHAHIRRP